MPKSAHHNFRIVDKLFKFALCLLGYIPRIRIVAVFNNIASGFNRHIAEAIFKIAYLCRTEGVVRRSEHDRLGPIINGVMCLLHTQEKPLAIFTNSGLAYVHHSIICLISAEQEIHATLFENIQILALVQSSTRDFICNPGPVGQGAFNPSARLSIHQK